MWAVYFEWTSTSFQSSIIIFAWPDCTPEGFVQTSLQLYSCDVWTLTETLSTTLNYSLLRQIFTENRNKKKISGHCISFSLFRSSISDNIMRIELRKKSSYLYHGRWTEVMFAPVCLSVCLSVCLWTAHLKKLSTDSDETWWTRWVCHKDDLSRYWWKSKF